MGTKAVHSAATGLFRSVRRCYVQCSFSPCVSLVICLRQRALGQAPPRRDCEIFCATLFLEVDMCTKRCLSDFASSPSHPKRLTSRPDPTPHHNPNPNQRRRFGPCALERLCSPSLLLLTAAGTEHREGLALVFRPGRQANPGVRFLVGGGERCTGARRLRAQPCLLRSWCAT